MVHAVDTIHITTPHVVVEMHIIVKVVVHPCHFIREKHLTLKENQWWYSLLGLGLGLELELRKVVETIEH
jgi:hypothetical protein